MRAPAVAAACLALAACTHPARYDVYATGYTGGVAASVAPGTAVALVPNPRAANPLLEREVLDRVRRHLADAGYPVAPLDAARVALYLDYGTGSHVETGQTLTYTPGATTVLRDSAGKQIGTARASDTWSWTPESYTAHDWWLTLTAVDASAYREARTTTPLWIGEARNAGADLEPRRILGLLAGPVVARFGRNTPQARVTLRDEEPAAPADVRLP